MKLITWNCNMAFRTKATQVLELKPDILIIPECEQIEKIDQGGWPVKPTSAFWFGTNIHKGLGVFSFNGYKINVLPEYNENFKIVAPFLVSKDGNSFHLYAVWANNHFDTDGRYIEQVWKAIHHYDKSLSSIPSILAGDFNSNSIWDKSHGEKSHSAVVDYLYKRDIVSAYHSFFGQSQGEETQPTLYMYRNQSKPYHIDYCFLSSSFASHLQSVEVGDFDSWSYLSDHVPIIVELESY